MAAHTDNEVVIDAPIDYARGADDGHRGLPSLFSEYAKAEVLEEEGNTVQFRLTTHPDPEYDGQVWSWVSERVADPDNRSSKSRRIETGPFEYMSIEWYFEEVEDGTRMRWVQDFSMKPDARGRRAGRGLHEPQHEGADGRDQGAAGAGGGRGRPELRVGTMLKRGVIVAKIKPGAEEEVAKLFAESDATELPGLAGFAIAACGCSTMSTSTTSRPTRTSRRRWTRSAITRCSRRSARLDAYITPYDPETWRSPKDAQARQFYGWDALG